jgi:hypothetical protein
MHLEIDFHASCCGQSWLMEQKQFFSFSTPNKSSKSHLRDGKAFVGGDATTYIAQFFRHR